MNDLQSQRDELQNTVDTFEKRIQQLEGDLQSSENEKLNHLQGTINNPSLSLVFLSAGTLQIQV